MMRLVSYVLNPLILPTAIFAVLFYRAPLIILPLPEESYPYLLAVILLTTCLIPLLSILSLKYTKSIDNIFMENRKQRVKPFLFVSAFYGFNTYMFYSIDQLNDTFLFILGSISLSVIILSFITLFWKISIHCAAIAGAIGIFLSVSQKFPLSDLLIPTAISVLLTGLVMTSRLSLKAHSYSEVYIGTLFGFALNYVFVYLTL